MTNKIEPFGYFRAQSFGWEDCSKNSLGAQPLYDQRTVDYLHDENQRMREALEVAKFALFEELAAYDPPIEHVKHAAEVVDAALSAAPRQTGPSPAPEGWKLVPVVPTPAMIDAAMRLPNYFDIGDEWRAMIAAAPQPPVKHLSDIYTEMMDNRQPPTAGAISQAVGWQPIETAPKCGRLLATMKDGATSVIIWLDADHPDADEAGWHEHWQFDPVEPTHWMPLPAPPAIAARQEGGAA